MSEEARSSPIENDWILWQKLLSFGKTNPMTSRDLAIEQAVELFVDGIPNDPAYQANAIVEGTVTPIAATRTKTYSCDIKAAPKTDLHIGDLVECFDEKWLVVELYADKVGILNGTMWLCNEVLRFQNHSESVITRYCVIDDGSYSRVSSDPAVYVPTNTYKIYVSRDAQTRQIFVDKRFSFGKIYDNNGELVLEVYKTIGIDLKSRNFGEGSHLTVLTLQRDVYNETVDDFDNEICDRFVPSGDTPEPAVTGSCTVVGRDNMRIGTTRKYTALFTDAAGHPVSGVTPVWTVTAPQGVTYEAALDGSLTITVPFSESFIGTDITVSLKDADEAYGTYEKKVGVITVG